jgi:arsenate reductase
MTEPSAQLYGIPNCSTVKKARLWLDAQGIKYQFFDFKKHAPTEQQLFAWSESVGWETLLNRKGTTWRNLPDADKAGVTDAKTAFALMIAHPSVIKRPVFCYGHTVQTGFDADAWHQLIL